MAAILLIILTKLNDTYQNTDKQKENLVKIIRILLLTLCTITLSITALENTIFTPKNTIIATDLDDTLIKHPYYQKIYLLLGGIWQNPLNSYNWLTAIFNIKNYHIDALQGKEESATTGLTFQCLFYACQDETFIPYIPWIRETIENSYYYIEGTKEIYHYLKNTKGYTIVITTNGDRVSYDAIHKALNFDIVAQQAFVAHPKNNDPILDILKKVAQKNTTPPEYKQLLNQALTVQPSNIIHHVPSAKPYQKYFEYIIDTLGQEKNIIFIDDKQKNIDGFNNVPNNSNAQRHGILFTNAQKLANELIKLGILSETEDKTLLNKIYKRG